MVTQQTLNCTLDFGRVYIIFSGPPRPVGGGIFAGMIMTIIAYFLVINGFDLEKTLVDTLYTVVYIIFVFRLFEVNMNNLLRDVPLIIKGSFYFVLEELIPRFSLYTLILGYKICVLIYLLLDIPITFVIMLPIIFSNGGLFFFYYLRMQINNIIRGYSQNTGAIGTDKSNPWMKQNWVGTEPVNLPFELVQWICGYTDAKQRILFVSVFLMFFSLILINFTNVSVIYCESTDMVIWGPGGAELHRETSNVGYTRFGPLVSNIITLPPFIKGVIVGLILSDGWLTFASKTALRAVPPKGRLVRMHV
jgi:hypothetical protein